jgi:IclR family acetate operon transcriptional repressor
MPKRTDKTITDVDAFLEDLRISRIRGFALDNEEDHEGVFCIGALVPDADDSVAGAISVSGLKQSVSDAELLQMGEQLVRLVAGPAARAPE